MSSKRPKLSTKRKQQVQIYAVVQSQDDLRDEVGWKVSPPAQRLAASGDHQLRVLSGDQPQLQQCQNLQNKSELERGTLSKKKKSPGLAGKLELWLSSSQRSQASKPITPLGGCRVDIQGVGKENILHGRSLNYAEPKKGTILSNSTGSGSSSKRKSISSQKPNLSKLQIESTGFSKGATKQKGQRRKALLELLDRVDDALVVKSPALIQSRISFSKKSETSTACQTCPTSELRDALKPENVYLAVALPSSSGEPFIQPTEYTPLQAADTRHDSFEYTDPRDCNSEVLTRVQVLDIRSESRALTNLESSRSLAGSLKYPEVSDAELGVPNTLGNIQFLVLEVDDVDRKANSSLLSCQKNLRLLNEHHGYERVAQLRDTWVHAEVHSGDIVNVIGAFDNNGKMVIDDKQNLIVINPDFLVSGSKVSSSFTCARRAVLDERVKSSASSYVALMGIMLHQLFQIALRSKPPTSSLLKDEAVLIIQRHLEGLYATGVSEEEAIEKLLNSIPTILGWWEEYIQIQLHPVPEVEFGKIYGSQPTSITEVLDIEEMIWSPKYGLKGMIDASVDVKLGNLSLKEQDQIMPLEFKTGRASSGQSATEHRAQVMLYTLLMSDRYMRKVGSGLLYYLQTNQTQGVEVRHFDLAGLMMRRNEHASSLVKSTKDQSLPPMLKNYRTCQGCRHLESCMMYHKAQDGGTGQSSGLGELFDRSTEHLTKLHVEFFQKWDRMIDHETENTIMSQSEIWKMRSNKREEQGRCISSLVLDVSANHSEKKGSPSNSFLYIFKRDSAFARDSSQFDCSQSTTSFQDTRLSCGDYVLLSTESGHVAVAGGIISHISDNSVVLRLSHRLRLPAKLDLTGKIESENILWRIDKDDSASSMALMRFNLLQLFVKSDGDIHRRSVVVDLQAPRFGSLPVGDLDPALSYLKSVKDLNEDQTHAIHRIISARDYALILGMPGTGKTSTIVHAVIALLARNSSVLLTSYTNSAIDNILLKLKELDVDFLRVGRTESIHPELEDKVLSAGVTVRSMKEFQSVVERARVVGVTCLGITHELFAKRKFDVCIIDEAGQISLPVSLGPIRCASTFVLVGDHYQLPPLVRSLAAKEEGMSVSLLRRLSEAHPQSISILRRQVSISLKLY